MGTKYGFQIRVRDSYGNVSADENISVYLAGTTTPANIYSTYTATTGTSATPQLTSNSNGYAQLFVDPDDYVSGLAQLFDFDVEDSDVDYTYLDIFKQGTSTDGTLSGNSNSVVPTEKAVKTYVDTQVSTVNEFTELSDTPNSFDNAGAIYNVNTDADGVNESTVILTEGTNTFNITKGTASLDIAAGAAVDVNANLTVESASVINQDLSTDSATVQFATLTSTNINAFTLGGKLTAGANEIEGSNFDIDGGTVDGCNVTVGSGKVLDVSAGTLTLADNQISGDKVEGGTINAVTINTLGLSAGTTVNEFSIDGTMAGDSDDAVPTEKAVKSYVDDIITKSVTYNNTDTTINLTTSNLNSVLLVENAAAVTINLPSVNSLDIGKWVQIHKMGAGNINITRADSDTIEDGTSVANTTAAQTWANVTLFLARETLWKFYGSPLGNWSTS
jgi:hypothetical protein